MTRVVGVVLARDEDIHVERAVRNIAGVCDELLLFDHRSRDDTPEILGRLARELPQATFERVDDPAVTHERLRRYVGTDTWVLGVDGDELYDPAGLRTMRGRIEAGEFADCWSVKAMQLHCRRLGDGTASGWLAPPARCSTKLYNFSVLESWDGDTPERLHGGVTVFSRDVEMIRTLKGPWDEAVMRCLHVCFLRRSSRQRRRQGTTLSHLERRHSDSRRRRLWRDIRYLAGRPPESWWKLNKYRQGPEVTVSAEGF